MKTHSARPATQERGPFGTFARRLRVARKRLFGRSVGTVEIPDPAVVGPDGRLFLRGWFVSLAGQAPSDPATLSVFVDDEPVGSVEWGLSRADVASLYPFLHGAAHAGFEGSVAVGAHRGECELALAPKGGPVVLRRRVRLENAHPLGAIETPDPAVVGPDGRLFLRGWFVSLAGQAPTAPATLSVFVDDEPVGSVEWGLSRTDVASLYPSLHGAAHAGFEGSVAVGAHRGECELALAPKGGPVVLRRRVQLENAHPLGAIEGPQEAEVNEGGGLVLKGWCLPVDGPATSGDSQPLTVLLDGEEVGCVSWGQERADVASRYPYLEDSSRAGFRGFVAAENRRGECEVSIALPGAGNGWIRRTVELVEKACALGAIEGPAIAGVDDEGMLELRGWCLPTSTQPPSEELERLSVFLDGEEVGSVAWGYEREDVGAQNPHWENASRAGFRGSVHVGARRGHAKFSVAAPSSGVTQAERTLELEDARPLTVLMDFTDHCNLKCVMCHFSIPGRNSSREEISIEEFERLAPDLLPKVNCLGLSCSTEPFMQPDFLKTLPTIREYRVPFVYYVTNATMLTDDAIRETIRWGVDLVMVSFDSAHAENFEAIRRNSDFDTVVANIRRLRDMKVEMGSALPKLRFNIALMRANIDEIEDIVRMAKELGVEELDLRHLSPYEGLRTAEDTLFEHKERANRQLDKVRALAAELGLVLFRCPENFKLEEEPATPAPATEADPEPDLHLRSACRMPWTTVVIHPDGDVIPCTNWFTHEPMGNIKRQSIDEIWDGARYRELRRQLESRDLGPNCRICPAMAHGSVDREESFRPRKV